MKRSGGEESLTVGHGLETAGWRNVMKGSIAEDLKKLGDLKIRTKDGLFTDFLIHTRNAALLHNGSSAVTGYCKFEEPNPGAVISLQDLFTRTPDLRSDDASLAARQYAYVSDFSYGADKVLKITLSGAEGPAIASVYGKLGYDVGGDGNSGSIRCESDTVLRDEPPMFVHAYMHNVMRPIPIPDLYLAMPFPGSIRLSQLCITYVISYALGILVRYYPTQWIALINGGKGDLLWPTINRAQQYVESTFPELVAEYISYVADKPAWVAKYQPKV